MAITTWEPWTRKHVSLLRLLLLGLQSRNETALKIWLFQKLKTEIILNYLHERIEIIGHHRIASWSTESILSLATETLNNKTTKKYEIEFQLN